MWFSIILTIIATILIAPSGGHWFFNLSGGSRTISMILLVIFWIINIIWFFCHMAQHSNTSKNTEEIMDSPKKLQVEIDIEEFDKRHNQIKESLKH